MNEPVPAPSTCSSSITHEHQTSIRRASDEITRDHTSITRDHTRSHEITPEARASHRCRRRRRAYKASRWRGRSSPIHTSTGTGTGTGTGLCICMYVYILCICIYMRHGVGRSSSRSCVISCDLARSRVISSPKLTTLAVPSAECERRGRGIREASASAAAAAAAA